MTSKRDIDDKTKTALATTLMIFLIVSAVAIIVLAIWCIILRPCSPRQRSTDRNILDGTDLGARSRRARNERLISNDVGLGDRNVEHSSETMHDLGTQSTREAPPLNIIEEESDSEDSTRPARVRINRSRDEQIVPLPEGVTLGLRYEDVVAGLAPTMIGQATFRPKTASKKREYYEVGDQVGGASKDHTQGDLSHNNQRSLDHQLRGYEHQKRQAAEALRQQMYKGERGNADALTEKERSKTFLGYSDVSRLFAFQNSDDQVKAREIDSEREQAQERARMREEYARRIADRSNDTASNALGLEDETNLKKGGNDDIDLYTNPRMKWKDNVRELANFESQRTPGSQQAHTSHDQRNTAEPNVAENLRRTGLQTCTSSNHTEWDDADGQDSKMQGKDKKLEMPAQGNIMRDNTNSSEEENAFDKETEIDELHREYKSDPGWKTSRLLRLPSNPNSKPTAPNPLLERIPNPFVDEKKQAERLQRRRTAEARRFEPTPGHLKVLEDIVTDLNRRSTPIWDNGEGPSSTSQMYCSDPRGPPALQPDGKALPDSLGSSAPQGERQKTER